MIEQSNSGVRPRGRPAMPSPDPSIIVEAVLRFLQMCMTETLSKRIVGMVLIAAGAPNSRITEMVGMSDRSIWTLRKAIRSGDIDGMFAVGHGSGREGKAKGLEGAIAEELESGDYHTRQQIADMILERFGVQMSVSAVGRLLKKTASGG